MQIITLFFFIYNANNNSPSVVRDFFYKTLSSRTYPCQLCKLTYETFTKKQKWTNYLSNLNYKYEFIYKNDMGQLRYSDDIFPIILIGNYENNEVLVSSEELNACTSIDKLIDTINDQLEKYWFSNKEW